MHAKQAVAGGATVLFGGGVPSDEDADASGRKPGVGYYVSPTILAGAAEGDEAWEEEIFGPVRCFNNFFFFFRSRAIEAYCLSVRPRTRL